MVLKKDEIIPKVLRAAEFRSTIQTPNSEEVKNQYVYRIMVFTYGAATVAIGDECVVCGKNDILYLLPNVPYQVLNTHGDFSVINIYFDYQDTIRETEGLVDKTLYQKEFVPELCRERYEFTDFPNLNEPCVIQNNPDIAEFSFKILKECERGTATSRRLISLLMACVIEEMCLHRDDPGRKDDQHEQIVNYIRENAHAKITAGDLSDRFHYHKNHINRIIKNKTGMNLKAFILKTKIELADRLIENTDMNITEIANYLNFFDASHFLKIYKRRKNEGY